MIFSTPQARGRPQPFLNLCLVLAAVAVLPGLGACTPKTPPPVPPTQVTVARPLVRDITDWDEFTGRLAAVESVESVEVRARVDGYLRTVNFKEGALARKGDLLFEIDPRPVKVAMDQAKATLTVARARLELTVHDLERAQGLIASHTISARDLDAGTRPQQR